ncbi:MAG TPA: putative sugar O-methyltransferase [Stellaceae bacterium]
MRSVLPAETRGFLPLDQRRAEDVARRARAFVEMRDAYVRDWKVPEPFAYADANWSPEARNPYLTLYRRVLECDDEIVGQFRAFTQMFTGFNLYEMRGKAKITQRLDDYTDEAIERVLDQNLPFVERWQALTQGVPARCRFAPPYRFGEIGHEVEGVIINHNTCAYQERINLLWENGVVDWLDERGRTSGRLRLLEIGAGYGALAYWFQAAFPGCSYTIVDLPECLLFSGLYLSLARPDLATRWGLDPDTPMPPFGFRFVPNYMALQLAEPFDLVINTLSMSEMSAAQVEGYCRLMKELWLCDGGIFFEQNQANPHFGSRAKETFAREFRWHRPCVSRVPAIQGEASLWALSPL